MAAFALQKQNWSYVTGPIWPTKLEIPTIWSLQKYFAKPCTEAFILPLKKRAYKFSGVHHSHPLLPNTWHTKSRDWVLTSISEFSYLFNYISIFTFIKCVALPRSSLGTLHTYSNAAASVLDILGAALQSQVTWYLRKFPFTFFLESK